MIKDMTVGSPLKLIIAFAIPVLIGECISSSFII